MKAVFLHAIGPTESAILLRKLHALAAQPMYRLVDDPAAADLVIICCSWSDPDNYKAFRSDTIVNQYWQKAAAYCDDDVFVPLMPGVYCSPLGCISTAMKRVTSYSYIARHVQKGNPHIQIDLTAPKRWLFSFQGASTAIVRKRLFRMDFHRDDVLIEDTSAHRNWVVDPSKQDRQVSYARTLSESHFVLCPRGGGSGSFRFFEVMRAGVAPVMIANGYPLPEGPDWDKFLVRISEGDIAKLPQILEPLAATSAERGRLARQAWEQWFGTEQEFNQIVTRCFAAHEASNGSEWLFRASIPLMVLKLKLKKGARQSARFVVLKTMALLGMRKPTLRSEDPAPFRLEEMVDDLPDSKPDA